MPVYAKVGSSQQDILTEAQARKRPELILMQTERPGTDHVATASGDWAVSRDTLLTMINEEKKYRRDSGFLVGGMLWDSDYEARLAYAEAKYKFAADSGYVVPNWKVSAGVWVTMNKPLFDKVYEAGEAHIAAAFDWQRRKEDELAAMPDSELNNFII